MDDVPLLESPAYRRKLTKLLAPLTRIERRVLKRFVEEPNDKTVAQSLGKRPQTIRNQIATILRKLEVESREELILLVLHIRFRGCRPKARSQTKGTQEQNPGNMDQEPQLQ